MSARRLALCALVAFIASVALAPPAAAQPILVDHRRVELFERIPPAYVAAARELRLLFSDRSVGQNIHESLDCLTAPSWPDAPAACRRDYYDANWNWKTYSRTDWLAGLVPARILFTPDPAVYHRGNWTFEYRAGNWDELTEDFITSLAPAYLPTKDVLSYQFSYLNAMSKLTPEEVRRLVDAANGRGRGRPKRG